MPPPPPPPISIPSSSVSSSDCEAPHPELLLLQRRLSGSIAEESVEMAHPRANSIVKFEEDKFHSARVAMRDELTKLLEALPPGTQDREAFERDMESFYILFLRFLSGINEKKLDWNLVRSLGDEHLLQYATLPEPSDDRQSHALLSKLAVVKLNGGLGTTMGCVGPKSAIEVREGLTFLDLSVRQMEYLNQQHSVNVPLILMNSFNTHAETRKIVQKYRHHRIDLLTFKQSKFPRISKESLLPLPTSSTDDNDRWYPPGHGNVFEAILNCGLLDELLAKGIEYLFISNIDNLGATVDLRILRHLQDTSCEFLMEVTDKTRADIKGGTLVEYNDEIRLLEIAQVPPEHRSDFTSVKKFKIFNTNNLWVSTRAIRRLFDDSTFGLDVIVNEKTVEVPQPSPDPTERNGNATTKILQLETAAGAAIKHFPNSRGVVVPRSRFLPVKSCSDLFLVHSDLYSLSHGSLIMNPKRQFATVPLVKLGDHFKKVSSYLGRFAGPPKILELDHLTVSGDVTFGKDVVLKGTVIVVANHGCRIDIPSGAVLDDKVVSGSLRILDH